MIQSEILVAGQYSALLTPFHCPRLGMVCGIRTAAETVVWIVPETAISNPEVLGRVHHSIRVLTPIELVDVLEQLSTVGALALCCDEAETEIRDLYKQVPERTSATLTLCTHLNMPKRMDVVHTELYNGRMDKVGQALYQLMDMLVQFEPDLFDVMVPRLSELFLPPERALHFHELISFNAIRSELKSSDDLSYQPERKMKLEGICADGLWREIATVRNTLTDVLEQLLHDFPNFSEVTIFLMAQTELGRRRRIPAQSWPPILLVGAPGCGKSAYFRRLANILDNEFFGADLSHMHGRFELVGLHPSWRGGTSGFLANALLTSRYINPLIFFDEIDKANASSHDGNLINSLLTMLEPDSSKAYVDQYLRLPMDVSHILWCFAANDTRPIPAAALSRMQVFHIKQPTENEQLRIIKQMYGGLAQSSDLSGALDPEIPPEVVIQLVSRSVREVRLRLNLAIASAALRLKGSSNRIRLVREDVPMFSMTLLEESIDGQTLH